MKKRITKKSLIIMGFIIAYIIALPLGLYFSGVLKNEPKDLKTLYIEMPDYIHSYETSEFLTDMGFNIQAFEDSGFVMSNCTAYALRDEPNNICKLQMEFSDNETYYIKFTIYMPEVIQDWKFDRRYNRQEIHGKSVGVCSDDFLGNYIARYCDDVTGRIYYIEPLFGFNEVENNFISLLILSLKRYG